MRGSFAEAVGAIDVLLLGWEGEERSSACVTHRDGLAARRWRGRGDRRLELDVQEGRVGGVWGGEVQKGVRQRLGRLLGRGGGARGGRAHLVRELGRELRGRLLLGVACRRTISSLFSRPYRS